MLMTSNSLASALRSLCWKFGGTCWNLNLKLSTLATKNLGRAKSKTSRRSNIEGTSSKCRNNADSNRSDCNPCRTNAEAHRRSNVEATTMQYRQDILKQVHAQEFDLCHRIRSK